MKRSLLYVLLGVMAVSCTSKMSPVAATTVNDEGPVAFPGAEGFGKYTTGGRGGEVLIVTNLNDAGPGSLREAVESKFPAFIVFAVSGTIHLEKKLSIAGDKTIAGQTAPGDGICVADQPVTLGGNNIIVRYMRFRMGGKYQDQGKVDGAGGDDAFGGIFKKNIIIDHCSMSWSTDEVCSIYAGDSTTLQWNIISEPLNYSYHFEKGDTGYEHHGYGGIWGGVHASFHHNLIAHCNSRAPRFNGIRHTPVENCDYVNNVIYNWGHNNVYAGEGGTYNIVNNYYRYGPDTKTSVISRIANPFQGEKIPYGKWYIEGNYMDGSPAVTQNNWLGVTMEKGTAADAEAAKLEKPFKGIVIHMQSPTEAYNAVLQHAGASYRRDTLDQRIIGNVKTRTGKIIDVQGGFLHGTPYEQTKTAWPALRSLQPAPDSDKDGIPDEWEKANRLDPSNASDAIKHSLDAHYTNIEVYVNTLTIDRR